MWSSFRKRLSSRGDPARASPFPVEFQLQEILNPTSNATCITGDLDESDLAICDKDDPASDDRATAACGEGSSVPQIMRSESPSTAADQEDSTQDDKGRRFSLSDALRARFLRKPAPLVSLTVPEQVVSTDGQLVRILARLKYPAPADADAVAPLDVVCVVDISQVRSLLEVEDMMDCLLEKLDSNDRLALVTARPVADQSPLLHQFKRMTSQNKQATASMALALPRNRPNDLLVALAHAQMLLKAREWSNDSCALIVITDQLRRSEAELELVRSLLHPIIRLGAGVTVLGVGSVRDMVRWHRLARSLDIACCAPPASALSKVIDWLLRSQRLPSFHDLEVLVSAAAPSARLVAVQAIGGSILLQDSTGDAIVKFRDLYCGEVQDLMITVSLPEIDLAVADIPVLSVKASAVLTRSGTKVVSRRAVCKLSRLLPHDYVAIPISAPEEAFHNTELLLQTIAALDQAALFVTALDFDRGKELLVGAYMRLAIETAAVEQDVTLQHLLFEIEAAVEQAVESQARHNSSEAQEESSN